MQELEMEEVCDTPPPTPPDVIPTPSPPPLMPMAVKMGYWGATSYVVGNIVGSGIFIFAGRDPPLGRVARPYPGADFAYICYVHWYPVAFAFMWVSVLMVYPACIAVISESFGQYLLEGLRQSYEIDEEWLPIAQKLFGISLLWLVTWINFFELSRFASRLQIVATFAKLLACALIILTGFYFYLFKGWNESLEQPMKNSNYSAGSLLMSLYGGLYAFSGWDILKRFALAVGISFVGDLDTLIGYVMFGFWAQRIFSLVALLTIRYRGMSVHPDAIRMPIALIVAFLAVTVGLVVIPIWQEFQVTALGIAICSVGFGFYYLLIYPNNLPRSLIAASEWATFLAAVIFNGMPDVKTVPLAPTAVLTSSDSQQLLLPVPTALLLAALRRPRYGPPFGREEREHEPLGLLDRVIKNVVEAYECLRSFPSVQFIYSPISTTRIFGLLVAGAFSQQTSGLLSPVCRTPPSLHSRFISCIRSVQSESIEQ
ncbi:Amino acid permease [Aphelenchoides fujianensis]|nr:Amino acid permease [Aphelenchoides fujianensis]